MLAGFWLDDSEEKLQGKLRQTSCCVCFVHVKCEGKDSLHLCFLIGISLGPLGFAALHSTSVCL